MGTGTEPSGRGSTGAVKIYLLQGCQESSHLMRKALKLFPADIVSRTFKLGHLEVRTTPGCFSRHFSSDQSAQIWITGEQENRTGNGSDSFTPVGM